MVNELSNKTLVIILLVTMVISVFGTLMSLNRIDGLAEMTGAWSGPAANATYASVNLTITSQLRINFTLDKSDFGSGYVDGGETACVLSTGLTADDSRCISFSTPGNVQGLYLENIGNEYANLNISNRNWSDSLIGGTNPGYAWQWSPEVVTTNLTCNTSVKHTDLPSPNVLQNLSSSNYPGENGAAIGKSLCSMFNYSSANNAINITFKLQIPQNAPARSALSDIWFAWGNAI